MIVNKFCYENLKSQKIWEKLGARSSSIIIETYNFKILPTSHIQFIWVVIKLNFLGD